MSPRTFRRPPARGFTLIEMAIALAMLVTLATLALPMMSDVLARHRVRAAGEALVAEMAETRFSAAQRDHTMHLAFATGADWCWAVATTPGCDCRVPQTCRGKTMGAPQFKGVELQAAQEVQFEPGGRGSGHAELKSSRGHVLRAEVGPSGRPRLCAPGALVPGVPGC